MAERLDDATLDELLEQLKNLKMQGETFTEAQKANIELRYPGFFDDQELTQPKTQTLGPGRATTPQTDVSNVLKQKEDEDKVSNVINNDLAKIGQEKRTQYLNQLGVDPFKDPDTAFYSWYNNIKDNKEVMSKLYSWGMNSADDLRLLFDSHLEKKKLEKLPGFIEEEEEIIESHLPSTGVDYAKKIEEEGKDLNSAWTYKDVAEGAHGIYDPLRKKVQEYLEDPTKENEDALNEYYKDLAYVRMSQGKPVYTAKDALKDITKNPWKYIPFGGWVEGTELYNIYTIAKKYELDPSSVTDEELANLREFIEHEAFKEHSTWAAGVTQIITQMPSFMIEMAASGALYSTGKKIAKKAALASIKKFVKGGIKEKVKKEVSKRGIKEWSKNWGKGLAKGTTIATIGTYTSGDINVREVENLMPGFEIQGGEIVKVYDGMDKLTARRQAVLGTFIEFASEMTGAATMKFLKTIGGAPWKLIMSTKGGREFAEKYIKLTPEAKNIVMNSAIVRAFKKLNSGASDADVDKIMKQLGYHGILEEMLEERVGDISRALAKKLSESGIVDGFDNPNWEWKIPSWYQLSQEFVAFAVPGGGRIIATSVKSKYQDSKFKKNNPAIANMVDKFTSEYNKTKEQYNSIIDKVNEEGENLLDEDQKNRITELKNKDKLSEEEVQELTGLLVSKKILGERSLSKEEIEIIDSHEQNKLRYDTITHLKNLIIESPEISDVIDLSEVDLEKELVKTAQELEEEYGEEFLKGEGESNKNEVYKILGFTTAANIQTGERVKLGLGKGATIDTVIEEYYGLIRRGGLTEKQTKAYDEHYEKYQTDKEFRKEINEHINKIHNEMGLGDRIDNTDDALSYDKLFDIEGKTYEYESYTKKPKDAVDRIFDYISRLFNKGMGRWELDDEIKDLYKQIQKRKLKVKPAKEEKEKPKVKAKPKAKPKKDKPSYQLSVKEVAKKLAASKEVSEKDKIDVAVSRGLEEVIKTIEESEDGIIHESLQWYFTSVDKTMDIASNEVDIRDKNDELTFKAIIALNSQRTKPEPNYNYAIEIFKYYQENGTFNYKPTKKDPNKIRLHSINKQGKEVIVGGLAGKVMTEQHQKLEFLFDKFGKEKALNWLLTKHTGKEIFEVLKEYGAKSKPSQLILDKEYYGSIIFGRKVGAFFANLEGKSDIATYDLWWSRTWNRWMGTPITVNKKTGEESIQETPRSNKEAALMDEAITKIADLLTEATGYKFTAPAVQSVLWYYEKGLYIKEDAAVELGIDYLRAAENRAKEKGYATTPTDTKRARRVTERRVAKEKRDTASLKKGIKKTGKKARQKAPEVSYQLTPQQKEFFKDTKVVDSKGEPKVVYHGTPGETKDFDIFLQGSWFSESPEHASAYARSFAGQRVYPVYLNIKSPIDLTGLGEVTKQVNVDNFVSYVENLTDSKMPKKVKDRLKRLVEYSDYKKNYDINDYVNAFRDPLIKNWSKKAGYDGIKIEKDLADGPIMTYFVFDSNQIKSATAMAEKPTTDPRISYQLEPTGLKTLYHVTPTKNLEQIKKNGLLPMQTTLWVDPKGNRQGAGEIYAFESLKDAQAWVQKLKFDLNADATIVEINNKDDRWNEDVETLPNGKVIPKNIIGPNDGRWFKRYEPINPENISVVDEAKPSYQLKPQLYSSALLAAENLPGNIKRQSIKRFFKDVTQAEMGWLGLDSWLNDTFKPNEKVPKEEIVKYIEANQLILEDVVLGDDRISLDKAEAKGWVRDKPGLWVWTNPNNKNEKWYFDRGGEELGLVEATYYSNKAAGNYGPMTIAEFKNYQFEAFEERPEPIHKSEETKWEAYTMEGGTDYIELLVTIPKGEFVVPSHFPQKGIVVHIRAKTRYTTDGKKVFFIEEIQSDWAQQANKLRQQEVLRVRQQEVSTIEEAEAKVPIDFGYTTKESSLEYNREKKKYDAENKRLRKEIYDYVMKEDISPDVDQSAIENAIRKAFDAAISPVIGGFPSAEFKDMTVERFRKEFIWEVSKSDAWKIMNLWREVIKPAPAKPEGLEETPYKHTSKDMAWIKLGIKKAILYAVENDFDAIALTSADMVEHVNQIDYEISSIKYKPIREDAKRSDVDFGRFAIAIFDKSNNRISKVPTYNTPEQLEDIVGKGIVEKLLAGEGSVDTVVPDQLVLSGLDLKTKSKFHRTIYEQKMPSQLKKVSNSVGGSGLVDLEISSVVTGKSEEKQIPPDKKTDPAFPQTTLVTRKGILLTDKLKDTVNKTGLPSFQLKKEEEPVDVYDDISGKDLKNFGKGDKRKNKAIKAYETGIIPISTLLKRIDPRIYIKLLRYQYNVAVRQDKAKELVITLDEYIKKMSKKDQAKFKLAMLNSDSSTMRSLIEEYDNEEQDFMTSFMNVRNLLDKLREQLIEAGEDVGHIEDYFPRKVIDYDKFMKYMYGDKIAKKVIEKQIAKLEKELDRPATKEEIAALVNKLIRGYLKSKPSYVKGRVFDKITIEMSEFYQDPILQLSNHMDRVIERIDSRKFLGFGENIDESIGMYIASLMEEGVELTSEEQDDVARIIKSYLNFETMNEILGAVKVGGYGWVLRDYTNVVTQIQDMIYGIYENGIGQHRTIANAVKYLWGKLGEATGQWTVERIKRREIGADFIGQEFQLQTMSGFAKFMHKMTNFILTGSGFKLIDGLGKSVLINSSVQKYKRKAQKNRLTKKDMDYLELLFDKDVDQAIEDLKKDSTPSEYTDAELFLAYATLLKYQPMGRTEVPLGYIENPNFGRTLYMLQTFAIKQLNVLRDEGLDVITGKQKGNKKQAMLKLSYLLFLMIGAGATGDDLKDWIKGRTTTLKDRVVDNVLKIILLNKYMVDKFDRERVYKGFFKALWERFEDRVVNFPPITVFSEMLDVMVEGLLKEEDDLKKSKGPKYIPWIGQTLYNRRDLSELSGIGGRGRDDYVNFQLKDLYKKGKEEWLGEVEVKKYGELIYDAQEYPQKRIVEGKEIDIIKLDKHIEMYKAHYNNLRE